MESLRWFFCCRFPLPTELQLKSQYMGNDKRFAASKVVYGKQDTYWAGEYQDLTGTLELDLRKSQTIKPFKICVGISIAQRVKLPIILYAMHCIIFIF